MSNQVESTPHRLITNSPQYHRRSRREEASQSPYSKRFVEGSTAKSIMSTKRNFEELNQKNQKIRQFQTRTSRLEQRVAQYEQQKEGLENTLKQRVEMYKRIIREKEQKSQLTLESIQNQFRLELKQLTQQKQEQQKFFQQQTQIINQKIVMLQDENYDLQQQVSNQLNLHSDLTSEIQKLKTSNASTQQQYDTMVAQKTIQIHKLEQSLTLLNKQLKDQRMALKHQAQTQLQKIAQQNNSLVQKLQTDLKALENLRHNQNLFKDNEIAQLQRLLDTQRLKFAHKIEADQLKHDHLFETEQLKQQKLTDDHHALSTHLLASKQNIIDSQLRDIAQLQHSLQQAHKQNDNLSNQIDQLNNEINLIQKDLLQCTEMFSKQKSHLHSVIDSLQEDLKLNQINYINEHNKNEAVCDQNLRLYEAASDREVLLRQIGDLRQLLAESSKEIETCRDKYMNFDRDNKKLLFELERTHAENNALLRVRRDLEQQAIKWRQNYLRVAR